MHGCICRRPPWMGLTAGAFQCLFDCDPAPRRRTLQTITARAQTTASLQTIAAPRLDGGLSSNDCPPRPEGALLASPTTTGPQSLNDLLPHSRIGHTTKRLHVVVRHNALGVSNELVESPLIPSHPGSLHRLRIIRIALLRSCLRSDNARQRRAQAVIAFLGRMTRTAVGVEGRLVRCNCGTRSQHSQEEMELHASPTPT